MSDIKLDKVFVNETNIIQVKRNICDVFFVFNPTIVSILFKKTFMICYKWKTNNKIE